LLSIRHFDPKIKKLCAKQHRVSKNLKLEKLVAV
jgi:hypothetical protein